MNAFRVPRSLLSVIVIGLVTLVSTTVKAALIPADLSIQSSICYGTGCSVPAPFLINNVTFNGYADGVNITPSMTGTAVNNTFSQTGDTANAFISNAMATSFGAELDNFDMYFNIDVQNNSATDSFDVTFGLDFFLEAYANIFAFDPFGGPQSVPIDVASHVSVLVADGSGTILSSFIDLGSAGGNRVNEQTFADQYGGYYSLSGGDSFTRSLVAGSSYSFLGSFSVSVENYDFVNSGATAIGTADLGIELLDVTNTTPTPPPATDVAAPSPISLMIAAIAGWLAFRRQNAGKVKPDYVTCA